MLTVHLATTSITGSPACSPQLGHVALFLEALRSFGQRGPGQAISRFVMPSPGACFQDAVLLPSPVVVIRLVLQCGKDRVAIVAGPVSDGDVISLIGGQAPSPALPQSAARGSLYAGTVVHSANAANPCEVRCDGGTLYAEDDCCVVCRSGATTVKFCC